MTTGSTVRLAFTTSLLAVAVAGLGFMDWRLLSLPVEVRSPSQSHQVSADKRPPTATAKLELSTPDYASFSIIAERPLFIAGRRFSPSGAAESAPPASEKRPQFRLSGIMLQANTARALLQRVTGQPAEWVAEGQDIDGWKVSRIQSGAVVLESGAGIIRVELYAAEGHADVGTE